MRQCKFTSTVYAERRGKSPGVNAQGQKNPFFTGEFFFSVPNLFFVGD